MARIRTIKPEFWTSEQVMECSPMARLLFIGLWNFCDDAGRMAMSPKRIKAQILPSDDITASDILGMLQELSANGLIRFYTIDGKEFLAVTGWHHQRIDKPQKPLTPDPPDPHSPNDPGTFDVGREKEKEGRGESFGGGGSPSRAPAREALTRHKAAPVAETARPDGSVAAAPPPWNSRENFDRIERRCREALPRDWVQDPVVGPMARLVADGLDLEAEIVPALLDLAASRRTPIRTWSLLANTVAERVAAQRQVRTAQGLAAVPASRPDPDDLVDLGVSGRHPEAFLRSVIDRFRRDPGTWIEGVFGPPPGQPGCRIPPRLLLEAA
ncbi:hypothetical protein [Methylobacterium brachiatum]|uniref:hypothetical protein n=1 Tax=Methylobacterium brachiatum TaxID=269660 RepID=UPI00244D2A8F|nr:hypothetical protein [Methylobacterium brachiatum]MDH2310357.1 hypothetical protein [Methylobacterium brachiatum]